MVTLQPKKKKTQHNTLQ